MTFHFGFQFFALNLAFDWMYLLGEETLQIVYLPSVFQIQQGEASLFGHGALLPGEFFL